MREHALSVLGTILPLYLAAIFTFYCLLHLLDFFRQVGSFQQRFCVAKEEGRQRRRASECGRERMVSASRKYCSAKNQSLAAGYGMLANQIPSLQLTQWCTSRGKVLLQRSVFVHEGMDSCEKSLCSLSPP